MFFGKRLDINYMRIFRCKCFVRDNGIYNLGNFDARSDKAVFLGYATNNLC